MKRAVFRLGIMAVCCALAMVARAQTCPVAQMTSPVNGATLPVGAVTFGWCNANADYFLTVESVPGAADIFNAAVTVTSVTLGPSCAPAPPIQCVPAMSEPIYVTLWTQIKGQWQTPFQYTYTAGQSYHTTSLVSDTAGAASNTDSHLVNPWGLAHGATTPWWISDNGTGVSTLYDGTGNPFPAGNPLVVAIPPSSGLGIGAPTGVVALGNKFVFVTLDGTISQWSAGTSAVIKVNSPGKVYTGCTLATLNSAATLYVANNAGGIEAYDTQFKTVALAPGAFTDPKLPAGYTPYNVQSAGGRIYVTFSNGFTGAGAGYVDAFDPTGKLLFALQHGNWMNVPWGIAMPAANFGNLHRPLLAGQLGSGQIAAFQPSTGKFLGLLKDSTGTPIAIGGLWGLGFGNDGSAGPSTTLYFTAGPGGYLHGLFGSILPD